MQTTIKQLNDVEYELNITATADELASELNKALRTQRTRTTMRGFRQGKVPMSLVKKMYGEAIAYSVAEQEVQKAYETEVAESDAYEVLGQPKLTKLEVGLDKDLEAVIQFGVRPSFELADMSEAEVYKLKHEITDEAVDQEVQQLRRHKADVMPVDETAGEDDMVVVDMQRIEDGAPIVGEKEEDVELFLNDDNVFDELKDALKGKKAGDTAHVTLPTGDEDGETSTYEVSVKEVKRLDLPELDEDFIKEVTKDQFSSEEELRDAIRKEMEQAWEKRTRELLEGQLVEAALKANPVAVPDAAIEFFLDSFVEDVKQRNDKKLPEGFNEAAFRASNRDQAEQQARWMLVRDKIVDDQNIEVTDEDIDAHLNEIYGDDEEANVDQMKQFYKSVPQLMDQISQQMLSRKVFDALAERMNVIEKDKDSFEEAMKARQEAEQASAAEAATEGAEAEEEASA